MIGMSERLPDVDEGIVGIEGDAVGGELGGRSDKVEAVGVEDRLAEGPLAAGRVVGGVRKLDDVGGGAYSDGNGAGRPADRGGLPGSVWEGGS